MEDGALFWVLICLSLIGAGYSAAMMTETYWMIKELTEKMRRANEAARKEEEYGAKRKHGGQ